MPDLEPNKLRKQYLDIKRQYPHEIVLFRLGDFYETFDDDAQLVSRELDLVLTSRPNMYKADGVRVPMAGVPHHALEPYIARLIAKGHHVAICEQMSADEKGFFRREVIRVVTPGTITEPNLLDAGRNNYLAALIVTEGRAGLAYTDISTGDFAVTTFQAPNPWLLARQELMRLRPAELLLPEGIQTAALDSVSVPRTVLPVRKFDPGKARHALLDHFGVSSLAGFGIEQSPLAVSACGAILAYVKDTQPAALNLLSRLSTYTLDEFMTLDPATRRNLELTETLRSGEVNGSLLGVLDVTATPMGARLLRQWVAQPLLDVARINERLDRVAAFHSEGVLRAETLAALKPLHDIERITNRILGFTANPRDMVALRETLTALPGIKELLVTGNYQLSMTDFDLCADVLNLLQTAIAEEPPAVLGKPGIIHAGYSEELDGILNASSHAREWIAGLEKVEKERTGIKTLKVGYNKIFGYYLEISRGQSDNAPDNYIRKQTLVNAERFITPELKEYETLVLNAEERILEIETRLFKDLCRQIGAHAHRLLTAARTLAQIDVLAALADVAARDGYVRPALVAEPLLEIRDGRHPVVEQYLQAGERFVPNDIIFEPGECVRVISGPNMSGKCVRGDTLVFTDIGLLPIAALSPKGASVGSFAPVSYTVKSLDGQQRATHFYTGGRQPSIRLRTRLGYELEGTPEHRVWVRFPDGREGWKPLKEIGQGEFLAIDRQLDMWGQSEALDTPRAAGLKPRTTLRFYQLPQRLTPDLAYV
ncbi:MAG: DNA mismatch repair protein MutS, partial [Anaerolineales bacterium]